jgi:hypothetical protein
MATFRCLSAIALVLFCVSVLVSAADKIDHQAVTADEYRIIRCAVCDRAIAHIWHQGVKLRQHCAIHGTDKRCDITNVHRFGVEEMVKEVCDELPHTHQGLLEDGEFALIQHEDPKHEKEVFEAIRASCVRWVHDEHTIDYVTRLMYANLDAGKATQVILHKLQERFCDAACRKPKVVEKQTADL